MTIRIESLASRLDSDQLYVGVFDERMKYSHGVRSSTYTGDDRCRQSPHLREHLRASLTTDHGLKLTYHAWIWCGSNH